MSNDLFSRIPRNPAIAFLGASDESAAVLAALAGEGVRVQIAVTKEPKRRSRGAGVSVNPVEVAARKASIEVAYDLEALKLKDFDLAVVVAFGLIIPVDYIQRWPFVNIHYSLLPRWRGAAPVERAILAGDRKTGVALMEIVEALDAGRVFDLVEVEIDELESSLSLRERLTQLGGERLLAALRGGGDFFSSAIQQSGEVTYAKKINKEEFRISSDTTVVHLLRLQRISRPYGISSAVGRVSISDCTEIDAVEGGVVDIPVGVLRGEILRLCDGAVRVGALQVEGKRAMSIAEFRRGNHTDIDFVS
ncbi:MAG: methionyl-tRNA formyltransferase [Actinomycetota bacterium]|nr:methionyl-tRNA formyltransferase [Actinomycetota bacterium]